MTPKEYRQAQSEPPYITVRQACWRSFQKRKDLNEFLDRFWYNAVSSHRDDPYTPKPTVTGTASVSIYRGVTSDDIRALFERDGWTVHSLKVVQYLSDAVVFRATLSPTA